MSYSYELGDCITYILHSTTYFCMYATLFLVMCPLCLIRHRMDTTMLNWMDTRLKLQLCMK